MAAREKDSVLKDLFQAKSLRYPPQAILLRAFKKERTLELWATNHSGGPYILVKSYGICATSGVLGPKRRNGDLQVPEGFYFLDWFNPESNFYLSLHINYPNASDRVLSSRADPGGMIYLHGDCVTIGCIPITDEGIKEIYWLAVLARSAGQRQIPIEIFPARLTDDGLRALAKSHLGQWELIAFWSNLKEGFDFFEKTHVPPSLRVNRDGKYVFSR